MKQLNLLLLITVTSLFFFCCSKDDSAPDKNDQKRQATMFTGVEHPVQTFSNGTMTPLPSGLVLVEGGEWEYRDSTSDPRVTGKSLFYASALFDTTFSGQFWGTAELIPDNGGSWDMRCVGERSLTEGSLVEVIGHGKGVLEGLVANWTYKCLPGETDYTIEGFIIEP